MNSKETMQYYYGIGYEGFDYLDGCEITKKRRDKSSNNMQDSVQVVKENKSPKAFSWKVISHSGQEMKIQFEFSSPGEISSSSLGRDKMVIELLDIRLFKSIVSGETVKLQSFEGKP